MKPCANCGFGNIHPLIGLCDLCLFDPMANPAFGQVMAEHGRQQGWMGDRNDLTAPGLKVGTEPQPWRLYDRARCGVALGLAVFLSLACAVRSQAQPIPQPPDTEPARCGWTVFVSARELATPAIPTPIALSNELYRGVAFYVDVVPDEDAAQAVVECLTEKGAWGPRETGTAKRRLFYPSWRVQAGYGWGCLLPWQVTPQGPACRDAGEAR